MQEITWNEKAQATFDKVINNLPQFHRTIAQRLVKESAEEITQKRNSTEVEEKDLIEAFFREIPPAFKDMMKRLFHQLEIDYSQYVNEE